MHLLTLSDQHGMEKGIGARQRHRRNGQGKCDLVLAAAEGHVTAKERLEGGVGTAAVVRKVDADRKQVVTRQMTHQADQRDHEEFDLVPVLVTGDVNIFERNNNIPVLLISYMHCFIGYPAVSCGP